MPCTAVGVQWCGGLGGFSRGWWGTLYLMPSAVGEGGGGGFHEGQWSIGVRTAEGGDLATSPPPSRFVSLWGDVAAEQALRPLGHGVHGGGRV